VNDRNDEDEPDDDLEDERSHSLFHTSTGLVDFVIIEEQLRQLADYSDALAKFSEGQLLDLKAEYPDYNRDDCDYEAFETIWNLKENVEFVTPAMLLMTLYVFFEKSLKTLCYSFKDGHSDYEIPKGTRFKTPGKNYESIIDSQLRYLREHCGFTFELNDDEIDLLDTCRNVRNDFAHGDWHNVRSTIDTLKIGNILHLISAVFDKIERGSPPHPQSQSDPN